MDNAVFLALGHEFDLRYTRIELDFYYDCNRPKRDLQNNILQANIII